MTLRACYAVCGTEFRYGGTGVVLSQGGGVLFDKWALGMPYAKSGTDIAYGAISLRHVQY
eukprot:235632-Rhodomonas_salina.2